MRSWTDSQCISLGTGLMWSLFLHFMTVPAAAFYAACGRSTCTTMVQFWQNQWDSDVVCGFTSEVWTYFAQGSDTKKKKKSRTKQMKCADQKKDRLPKVIPRVFTTLGASLIERLSTGILFPLADCPHTSTSVFCSFSFSLFSSI